MTVNVEKLRPAGEFMVKVVLPVGTLVFMGAIAWANLKNEVQEGNSRALEWHVQDKGSIEAVKSQHDAEIKDLQSTSRRTDRNVVKIGQKLGLEVEHE